MFGIVPKKAVTSHTILDFFMRWKASGKYKRLSTDHAERYIGEYLFMKKFLYIPCFKKVPAPAYTESHLTFIQDYRTDANRVFPIITKMVGFLYN